MRRLLPLTLLGLLLAPAAGAEAPIVGVDAFPFPLAPLRDDARTLVTVESSCGGDVHLFVEGAPAWAQATFDPPVLAAPACEGAWSDAAALTVRLAAAAPAAERVTLRVVARAGNASGHADVPIEVAFHNVLEVTANETTRVAKPQDAVAFEVVLTSHGNGVARVTLDVAQPPRALVVPQPVPVTLEPGKPVRVSIVAQTPYRNGQVDETNSFSVTFASAYALDPAMRGDAETLAFTVQTRGLYVPGAASWAALAAVALALPLRWPRA